MPKIQAIYIENYSLTRGDFKGADPANAPPPLKKVFQPSVYAVRWVEKKFKSNVTGLKYFT